MKTRAFLTLAEALDIHADQIARSGGQAGVRDREVFESALAQPEATFGGQGLHPGAYEMAAASAYPRCQNHPFIDGKKRTALACAVMCLELNGRSLLDPDDRLAGLRIDIASGRLGKVDLAAYLRKMPTERHRKSKR